VDGLRTFLFSTSGGFNSRELFDMKTLNDGGSKKLTAAIGDKISIALIDPATRIDSK